MKIKVKHSHTTTTEQEVDIAFPVFGRWDYNSEISAAWSKTYIRFAADGQMIEVEEEDDCGVSWSIKQSRSSLAHELGPYLRDSWDYKLTTKEEFEAALAKAQAAIAAALEA